MKTTNDLTTNIDKIHATPLGVVRIKRNLEIETDDVVNWCKREILNANEIVRNGKNWYAHCDRFVITVNANSYTIITAHKNKIKKTQTMNYTYILRCADDTFYTGWTNDLQKRVQLHNDGKASKYTRARLPVELVYHEEFEDKQQAQQREYAIKQLSRYEKELLIKKQCGREFYTPA